MRTAASAAPSAMPRATPLTAGAAPSPAMTAAPSTTPTAAPPLTLSVVVCAYTPDRWTDLTAAIASLHAQLRVPDEIILVVDHCPELAEQASATFDGVRVLPSTGQPGLSGARNTGVRAARHAVVAFLDDDAVADRRWSERLLAAYADPGVLGVGGLVEPAWDLGRPAWFPREFDWVVGCTYRGMPTEPAPVRNFIGANMSFRRDVLAGLEGFRPDLGRVGTRPLGGEETELCIRAVRDSRGGRLVYEPAAAVRHRVPAGRCRWAYFRARCYAEGLSKAAVARHAGPQSALASERAYLRRTIPAALLRPLRPGADRPPVRTAAALVVGVLWAMAGYCRGRAAR